MNDAVRFISCLILISSAHSLFSQSSIKGTIVTDFGDPLPFANVMLLDAADSSLVKGMITSGEGSYEVENVQPGTYLLQASMVGFQPNYHQPFKIEAQQSNYTLGKLVLTEATTQLSEVVVSATKPLYEMQMDRMVVNVQNSITSAGNTALEVLEKSPGVLVNRQNNTVSLNGQNGVVIMINNKITRLPIDAVVQMLDGMSSANIEKIELITQPPSKYEAEGAAGMINIKMIENEDLGTHGSFGVDAGYRGGVIGGGNLSLFHRKQKFGLLLNYSANYDQVDQYTISSRSVMRGDYDWRINSRSDRDANNLTQNLRLGLEYQLSAKTNIELMTTGYMRDWNLNAVANTINQVQPDSTVSTTMDVEEKNLWQGATLNLGINHQLNENQQLSFDLDYIYYKNRNPSDYQNTDFFIEENTSRDFGIDVKKITPLSIWVAKADYSHQINDLLKLELGTKASWSKFENDVSVSNFLTGTWSQVDSLTDKADLEEDIMAAYVSSSWNLGDRSSLNAGLRYEYTRTVMDTRNEMRVVDRELHNFFPTIFYQYEFDPQHSLQLSYGRRITRPTFNEMAPFVFFIDPYTFFAGNPALRPAIVDGYNASFKANSWMFSLKHNQARYQIAQFQPQTDTQNNIQLMYSTNLNRMQTWTGTLTVPADPFDWWHIQGNLTGNYQQVQSNSEAPVFDVYNFNLNLVNTFELPKNFSLEISGFYNSASLMGLYKFEPMGSVNAGIQKKLNDGVSTLRLAVTDIFDTNVWRLNSLDQENAFEGYFHIQNVMLTYRRTFGNQKLKKVNIKSGSVEEQRRLN